MRAAAKRCCNAVALFAAGFSIAGMQGPAVVELRPSSPTDPPTVSAPAEVPRTWSLHSGGWIIKVDGADVDIPTLTQQTRPIMRPHGPQPLSPYDQLIAYHAEHQGLDWRLVAAVIFEESRFAPDAVSDAGAVGLMQVMPIAAAAVGAQAFTAPNDNIRTGARYLRQLSDTFRESVGRDHLALVLAAYNMGPAHLRDAQSIARRFGYAPAIWTESMELVVPLLEQPLLCERLPNGCANGAMTVAYVNRILNRYDEYRRQYSARPADLDDGNTDSANPTPDPRQAASANG